MIAFLSLGLGIWCLIHAWRGVAPDLRPRLGFPEPGTPLRRSTRIIFAIGGVLLTGLGVVIVRR
jgi:hypothetical protein